MNVWIQKIEDEFNFLPRNIVQYKYYNKDKSYEELYYDFKERFEILKETKELIKDIKPMDIKSLFKHDCMVYRFIYSINDDRYMYLPNKTTINKCKEVIKYLKDK